MIYVIECQHDGWKHKAANTFLLKQILKIYPNEEIVFLAKKKHIEEVCKEFEVEQENGLYFRIINRKSYQLDNSDIYNVERYKEMLNELFTENRIKAGDRLYFANSSRGFFAAISEIVKDYDGIKVYSVIHRIAEKMISDGMEKENSIFLSLKKAIEMYLDSDNTFLITLSPGALSFLKSNFSKHDQKIVLLHLIPYANKQLDNIKSEKSNILIYGACINSNAFDIINRIIVDNIRTVNVFMAIRHDRKAIYDNELPNNIAILEKSYFKDKELEKYIEWADWILMPYSHDMYKVAASGVLQDAMMYQKPILALDTGYISFYNRKCNIGVVANSINELIECIGHLPHNSSDEYKKFVGNYRVLRELLEKDNLEVLRKIM